MSFIGALFKKPKAPDNPLTLSLDPNAPRKLILGKTALAGSFAFHGLSNSSRDLTRVALLAGHRCNGVTRIWADGQLAFSGRLQHGVRTPLTDFRRFRGLGGFTNDLHVTWYDGRPDQTADSWLTTTSHSPLGWSSTDRLRGCSYAIITMRHDNDNINTVLEMVFEVEGAPLYDRRLDTTAGGSGAQRWDDPSTWVWTDNAAVATDHYQLGMIGGENNDKLLFGMGLKTWQVPYDEFEANADTCDEIVNGQTRYATNGVLSAADDHKDNIVRLAEAMAAVPYDTGGRVIIRPQQARPISLTLSDSDLVSGADYDLSESPGGDDLVNTVRGEYQEPSVRYKEQEYPSVEDTDLISKDGRAFEVTLNLPLETSYIRAQRIANIELEVQKRRDIIEETFMPIANVLEVGDWFQRGSNLRGPSSKNYEVIDKQVFADKTVRIKGRETDPAITAFGVNQARPVDLPAPIAPFLPIRPSVPPATGVGGTESGGGATVPDGLITINPGVDDEIDRFDYFEVEYGVATGSGASLNITDGTREAAVFPNDGGLGLHITGLLPDTDYAWRIRGVTGELPTEWSGYSQFTTGVDFVATNSASLGGVPSAQIINGLSEITDVVVPSLSSSIDTLNDQVADTNADLLSAVDQAAAARLTLSNEADAARDIIEGELDRLLTILPSESIRLPFDAEQTAWWRHREYAPEREPAVLPSYFSFEDDPVEGNQLIIDGAEQTVIARFPIPMNRAEPRVFRFSGEFKVDRVATDGSADSRLLAILYGLGADHRDAGLAGAAVTTIQVFSESPGSDGWTPFEWEVTSSGSADDRVDDFLGASSNYPGSSVHLLRFAFQLNYNNGDGSMRARNFLVEDITDALENQSRILSEEQTRIDEDNALASSINILSSRTDDTESDITTLQSTKANQSDLTTEAQRIDALSSRTDDTESDITTLQSTKANQSDLTAEASRLSRVYAGLGLEETDLYFDQGATIWAPGHREKSPETEPSAWNSVVSFEDDPIQGRQIIMDGVETTAFSRQTIPFDRSRNRVFRFSGEFKVDRVATDGSADSRLLTLVYANKADYRDGGDTGATVGAYQAYYEDPDPDTGWTSFAWTFSTIDAVSGVNDNIGSNPNFNIENLHHLRLGFQLNYNNGDGSMRARNFKIVDITDALSNAAAITEEQSARVSADNAFSLSLSSLESRTDDTESDITTLQSTKANQSDLTTEAQRIDTITSRVNDTEDDINQAQGQITTLESTKADANELSAAALRVDRLEASVSGAAKNISFVPDSDQTDWVLGSSINQGDNDLESGVKYYDPLPSDVSVDAGEIIFDGIERSFFTREAVDYTPGQVRFYKLTCQIKYDRASSNTTDRLLLGAWYGIDNWADNNGEELVSRTATGLEWTDVEWLFCTSFEPVAGFTHIADTQVTPETLRKIRFGGQGVYNNGDGKMRLRNFLVEDITATRELTASVTQVSSAVSDIEGTLEASFALGVKAGTSGAQLELIALEDGQTSSSAARISADNIILDGSVSADSLSTNSVTAAKISSNAVTANKIAANAVTADKINVNNLEAVSGTIGHFRSATSGQRLEIKDDVIKVYDSSGTLRVRIGNLSG